MNTNKDVGNRLLNFGVKPSLQRIAIMGYLMEHLTHPTADTIFNDLYHSIPTLSKTTVYNTLKLLEEHGVILAINIDEKNTRYDADISLHAHFKCKKCGCVKDFPLENISVLKNVNDSEDFVITECQVYFKGYCKQCKETDVIASLTCNSLIEN